MSNSLQLHGLYSPPGCSVHGISQARILKWVAISFYRGSPPSRDQIQVSCIAGRFFTIWATREALNVPTIVKKLILKLAFNMYYFSKHTFSGGTFLTKHLFYILKEQKIVNQRHYKRSMSVFYSIFSFKLNQ